MVDAKAIAELADQIAREFHPEKIILFGSYAYGKPAPDSDVDLLIILPFSGRAVFKAVEMRLKIKPSFPGDLVVRTPEKVEERLSMDDDFMKEILSQGKVLYEADHR